MKKVELAQHRYESGFNCAQSVFSVFAEDYGMSEEQALKLSSPFGGGMKMAATCGALTGALMALGLARGYCEADETLRAESDKAAIELIQRWKAEIGPVDCKTILGYNPCDPVQKEAALAAGGSAHICSNCIVKGVQILIDLLAELA